MFWSLYDQVVDLNVTYHGAGPGFSVGWAPTLHGECQHTIVPNCPKKEPYVLYVVYTFKLNCLLCLAVLNACVPMPMLTDATSSPFSWVNRLSKTHPDPYLCVRFKFRCLWWKRKDTRCTGISHYLTNWTSYNKLVWYYSFFCPNILFHKKFDVLYTPWGTLVISLRSWMIHLPNPIVHEWNFQIWVSLPFSPPHPPPPHKNKHFSLVKTETPYET